MPLVVQHLLCCELPHEVLADHFVQAGSHSRMPGFRSRSLRHIVSLLSLEVLIGPIKGDDEVCPMEGAVGLLNDVEFPSLMLSA